jgi:hypothetical protein
MGSTDHDTPANMQITAMSLIKDEERLELLKEIGGTKVYEERRRDSLKVMHETEGRRTHIEEVVSGRTATVHVCPVLRCQTMARPVWRACRSGVVAAAPTRQQCIC